MRAEATFSAVLSPNTLLCQNKEEKSNWASHSGVIVIHTVLFIVGIYFSVLNREEINSPDLHLHSS